MVSLSSLRVKIENKIFSNLGSSCLVASVTTSSIDQYGDASYTNPTAVSATFVPWNLIDPRRSYQAFGDLQEGEMDAAFRYTQDLAIGYVVTFGSTDYLVNEIEEFVIQNGALVKVARLRKDL